MSSGLVLPEILPETHEPKWIEGWPDKEYHADKTGVGSSGLRKILKSPATFFANHTKIEPSKPTPAMVFGTLFHQAVLEPNKFLKSHVAMPDFGDCRLKDNKAKRDAWLAELPEGTDILEQKTIDQIIGMVESLQRHADAANLLKNGVPEISGVYRDPETGIKCRIRPDFLQFDLMAMVDLKTTENCTRKSFSRAIFDYQYHFQMAMYAAGVKIIGGKKVDYPTIIAIEKEPPYEVAVYLLDDGVLDLGEQKYRQALNTLKQCLQSNSWPRYQQAIENISVPHWAFYEE